MEMEISTTRLAAQPFLAGLPARQLEILAGEAMPAEFKADEKIFSEGGPANRFYLLLSGKVALELPGKEYADEREPLPIETIGANAVLGWSWLFPPYSWQFDARAVTPVKAIFFYGTRLRQQCEMDHDLGY
jgi:CRP-like cAMP-binding protein